MINIKVEKINVSKSFDRSKIYTPEDITDQVVMPIIDVERLDTTLDTSSLVIDNFDERGIEPFTRIVITLTNEQGEIERIYRLVHSDNPELLTYGTIKKYRHHLELIEPTKWLERFDVDNTTITNFLAFLYSDVEHIFPVVAPYTESNVRTSYAWLSNRAYKTNLRYFDKYYQGTTIDPRVELQVTVGTNTFLILGFIPVGSSYGDARLYNATLTKPDGTVVQLRELEIGVGYHWVSNQFTFDQIGKYKITQHYLRSVTVGGGLGGYAEANYSADYTWEIEVVPPQTIEEKIPTRYSIAEVINLVLSKVGDETTILRNGLDSPLFFLESSLLDRLGKITSPEFTFTQNTLFGVLSQIGTEINAIPRLIPSIGTIIDASGNVRPDYWTNWNVITFDFLGGDEAVVRGEISASEHSFNGDNYTTDFVSNVQNSFQTNNYDYVALTEPYEGGYISTRTVDEAFEISDNSACIKTSRPIQRIIELKVYVNFLGELRELDISRYVKESADYLIMPAYAVNAGEFIDLVTKNMAIYYTRGTNLIQGLDYVQPTKYQIEGLFIDDAINNIISNEATGSLPTGLTHVSLKDLMFRIKYVPYYNLKIKQFKPYITNNSGNNELYYNQQNTQTIDIESLGENMKGALLRTANEEITNTEYFKDFTPIIKAGQLTNDGYYAYQVNREITNSRIKATTTFSKNFNKWNEYIAIKKNYREWEISERESIESNPCYNEFCIISTKPDWENARPEEPKREDYPTEEQYQEALENYQRELGYYTELLENYKQYLAKVGGFSSRKAMEQILAKLSNRTDIDFKSIAWVVGTTVSAEYQGEGRYNEVRNTFLLPCACFSFGNSVCLNFGGLDNYAIGTYAKDKGIIGGLGYAVEDYVKYTDKYGQAQNIELAFGSDKAKIGGFDTFNDALISSKEFYKFSENELDENAILLDYRQNSFVINKDSRQKINFTGQLHFLTENEDIWLGKGFAQLMPFVGNTGKNLLKFATFSQKPDKFLSKIDTSIFIVQDMPTTEVDYDLKYIKYNPIAVENDCVGYGLIDNQNRVVLYFNQELKAGDQTEPIYFEFRRKI